jgi:xylulokinase
MGEAMVPVTRDREILGNSILGNDLRGDEFLKDLMDKISPREVFHINGNIPDVSYSFTKLAWIKKYAPDLYKKTDYFLPWADFVCFMLGAKPATNYSHANRTMLFDINTCTWSNKLLELTGIDLNKLAPPAPSGTVLGKIDSSEASNLDLDSSLLIISGGHDQCCAALGSGIMGAQNTSAMLGIGTYICAVPVYSIIPDLDFMIRKRLNIEHHSAPGLFVSFIYNLSGGSLVKWYKSTFARSQVGINESPEINYDTLFNEIPEETTDIIVIPRFGPTGPPDFLKTSAGTIANLSLEHGRADILKAILEGVIFYIKDFFSDSEAISAFGINKFIVNGGGAKSEIWLQLTADILNKTVVRNKATEAGSLGAAILAGTASEIFVSLEEGVSKMVKVDIEINPNPKMVEFYDLKFKKYKQYYTFFKIIKYL